MYQIISTTGKILAETDSPIYVKFNPQNGTWIPATENDAEYVVVNGERFRILGKKSADKNNKVAFIKKIDGAKKFQKLEQNNAQNLTDILDIIEAIVDIDNRLTQISNRLEALRNV